MRKLKMTFIALGVMLSMQSFASEKTLKPIETDNQKEVVIDLAQFGKYLNQENAKNTEGVYTTEDGRYVIAIVKNNEKSHDYIGIVISADNEFWNQGEVKFNFVLNENNVLEGFYYDSKGENHPIELKVNEKGLVCDFLRKVSIEELRNGGLALL